jgi:hypothetical protein
MNSKNDLREDKLRINQAKFKQINNEAFGLAMSKLNENTHHFAMRFCYRWLPSGGRKNMNDPKEDHRCFMCGQTREESPHFLRCRNVIAKRGFKEILEKIFESLNEIGALQTTRQTIMMNLKAWTEGKPVEREI